MSNDFLNISEAVLWDNLKRETNIGLKKLEYESNPVSTLRHFNGKYPKVIQSILRDIGKNYFKIFLYNAIKLNIKNKKWWESKNSIIKKTIRNFKFYFYPGYTTLENKRIFQIGNRRKIGSDDRFFTGIGNNLIKLKDLDKLKRFLTGFDNNPDACFEFKNHFWVDDIPSTIAFDAVLNQTYIDKLLKKNISFKVPSTHFWKSSQIKPDNSFIPMPLSSDNSELRILKVSLGSGEANYANNQASIFIKPENLVGGAKIIAEKLNA